MAKNLVIVESPAKAKTLKKFLGSTYKIEASVGHVRDLPKSELGIDTEDDYEPKYITIRGKGKILAKLRKEVKLASKVYLATDPDREGEAISWHLLKALKLDEEKASRITFNEITKNAVRKSIKEARKIDMDLVNAQQARRELDRIVGYKISPLLWKKVKKGLSAGRVQSVTLKIIVDREEEIENFTSEEYWSLEGLFKYKSYKILAKFKGDKNGKIDLVDKKQVDKIEKYIQKQTFVVSNVKKSERVKNSSPSFTTSTLQQEASKILGFATYKTMMIAQQLYEGVDIKGKGNIGLVSYIRTDSTRIADEAFEEVKKYIIDKHGKEFALVEKANYKNKGKTQDAHEAIRPTSVIYLPEEIESSLTKDQYKLYKLIWERFVASQMTSAIYNTLRITIKAGNYNFTASGSLLKFAGFLEVYKKNIDKEEEIKMPDVIEGDVLSLHEMKKEQHFTQPPARYSEAALVKTMEELGIGRPSTYAATISNLVTRRYVIKEAKVFYTTELGGIINNIMKNNFDDIVDVTFTAKMEEELDKVEEGEVIWKQIIRDFYPKFNEKVCLAEKSIEQIEIKDEETDIICDKCSKNLVIKFSKFGKFLACPGFPECRNTKPFFEEAGVDCPLCSAKVIIKKSKKGRMFFGCEDQEKCEFISWSKPTGKLCPECNGILIEKGTKSNKKIACSKEGCFYTEELQNEEIE